MSLGTLDPPLPVHMCHYSVKTHLTDLQAAKMDRKNGQALRSVLLSRFSSDLGQPGIYFIAFEWHSCWLMSQRLLDCKERVGGRTHKGIPIIETKVCFALKNGQKKCTEQNRDFSLGKTAGTKLRVQYDSITYAARELVVAVSVKTHPFSPGLFKLL